MNTRNEAAPEYKKLIAHARRLRKAAERVSSSDELLSFYQRLARWSGQGTWAADDVMRDPEWSSNLLREVKAIAEAAERSAREQRAAERAGDIAELKKSARRPQGRAAFYSR